MSKVFFDSLPGERRSARLAGLTLMVFATLSSGTVLADTSADGTSPAAGVEALSEITVTAEKRAEKLQEVPAAVTVLSGELIERSNALNVEQLINQVPDLSVHKGDIPYNTALFLRGIGTNSFALGAEPSVGYVVDGVVMGTSGQAFADLLDIERMEVIPGPQGTLFGKNSSAGVVNVVSRMPGSSYAADFDLSYFEGNETRAKAAIDLPITDQLLTRTTLFTGKYAGNLTNIYETSQDAGTTPINGYDHQGARTIWKYVPNDDLTFTLIADWHQSNDNCCTFVNGTPPGTPPGSSASIVAGITNLLAGTGYAGDETRNVAQSLVTRSVERQHGTSLQVDWSFDRFTLTDILAYRFDSIIQVRDGDFLPATAAYVGTSFEQEHDIGPQSVSTLTNELRLASPTGGTLEYVAGLFYYHNIQDAYFERDDIVCTASTLAAVSPGLVPCLPGASTYTTPSANSNYGAAVDNVAAFGQGTIRIIDPLRVIAGLRVTHDDVSFYHYYQTSPTTGGGVIASNCNPATACPFEGTGSTTHTNTSGKLGLQWDILSTEMAYATYSRGYKGPAYNVFFNQNVLENAPLPAETSVAYELGLKSTFLGGDAYLNAALFYETFDNFQANNPASLNGVVITTLADAGSVATQGFELQGAARLTPAWTANAGFTYANAHVTDFTAATGANPLAVAPAGSPLPFSPKTKLDVGTQYRLTGLLPFDLVGQTNYSYTGNQYTDFATCTTAYCPHGGDNPYLNLHGYGLWNASLGASDRDQRLTVTAIVKNILNKSYASFSQVGGPGGSIQYFIPRDADRYWGLELNYRFGK